MSERSSLTALSSRAAFTVTVWVVFQLVVVKVRAFPFRVEPDRERVVPPCPEIVTVTLAVGRLLSFTV